MQTETMRAVKNTVFDAMNVAKQEDIHAGLTHGEIIESLANYSDMPEGVTDELVSEYVRLWEAIDSRGTQRLIGCVAFTCGMEDRKFGGPEEGGWYYTAFEPIRTLLVPAAKAERCARLLQRWQDRNNEGRPAISSVLSYGRYCIRDGIVERTPKPCYE